MEHVCTRCARLSLPGRYTGPTLARIVNPKTFSTSSTARANKDDSMDTLPNLTMLNV